jgi:N-succinyldiaminopimelate aminotransferase
MNPLLNRLQPYPFEKLSRLKQGVVPTDRFSPISLSIGEPKHPTPELITESIRAHLSELTQYPTTLGILEYREAIATWLARRFNIPESLLDSQRNILPCSGTREALFSFAQAMLDPSDRTLVLMPNPFYQIYEGAALLAGAEPYFLNTCAENQYLPDFDSVPDEVWSRCSLIYVCSPGNPTGTVFREDEYFKLMDLAERFDFIIASDECYSELYFDESRPPAGLLGAAINYGNREFKRCAVFHSLSKRSNAPGLRSGFIAGDQEIISKFLLYRTYHGCAQPLPTQRASLAAWRDEQHVVENRALYREKFIATHAILKDHLTLTIPDGGFYLWPHVGADDEAFAKSLYEHTNITVLPGSYLSRDQFGINPGRGHVRIALVAPYEECVEAAERIRDFIQSH